MFQNSAALVLSTMLILYGPSWVGRRCRRRRLPEESGAAAASGQAECEGAGEQGLLTVSFHSVSPFLFSFFFSCSLSALCDCVLCAVYVLYYSERVRKCQQVICRCGNRSNEKCQNKRIKCVNAYKSKKYKNKYAGNKGSHKVRCVIVYVVQSTHSVKNTEYRT